MEKSEGEMNNPFIQVLYVDDEPGLLEIGRLFLEKSGDIIVETAVSASEAIRLLADQPVDAIVSDYKMPEMDGIAFLKHLRSGGDRTPFIIFTGRGREDVVIDALNNGADFYLQKGGNPKAQFAELSNKIRYAVIRREIERDLARSEEQVKQNERVLQSMLDATPAGVGLLRNGVFQRVNRSLCTITGYSEEELIGCDPRMLYTDEGEYLRSREDLYRQIGENRLGIIETCSRKKNGDEIIVMLSLCPFNSENMADGITATIIDITESRRAEAELHGAHEKLMSQDEELRMQYDALARSQAGWESTFNTISDWVSVITPDGEILQTNKAIEPLLGMLAEEVPGRKCFELVHGTVCPIPECPLKQMMMSGKQETSVVPKQDGTGWLEVTLDPVMNQNKEIVQAVHIVRDITETIRTQAALEKAKKKLNLLNYVTFNDLQNMILTISGYQQVVRGMLPENPALPMITKQEEILQKVRHSLKFAQSYQDLGLKPAIWQNVRHVFLMAISHLNFQRIKHQTELDNLEIFADPLLEQVFVILADNILTHGGSADHVLIYTLENDTSITIIYEDNGAGIPDEIKEKIFLADFQKKKGVGLFLAGEILEITGITIRETGVYGKGAKFEMQVPRGGWRRTR